MKPTTGYLVATGLFIMGTMVLNLLTLFALAFAGDGCGSTHATMVCTGNGTLAVLALPWLGFLLALACSLALGVPAARKGITPWPFLPLGILVYAIPLAGAWIVLTRP